MNLQAQVNHVLNPGLEIGSCIGNVDNIRSAKFWSAIDTAAYTICAPEYCHMDCTMYTGVPKNSRFYQYPRSGKGLAQVGMYFDESFPSLVIRDYLQGRLSQNLVPGHNYCVTFFVCLEEVSTYAISNIGAFIDDGTIDTAIITCGHPQTDHIPQVLNNDIITDTLNWVRIQGSFIAKGDERFITIGNFSDKAHTNSVVVSSTPDHVAYYLVDDVSVIESTATVNAGPDGMVSTGSDSAWIGTHEEGMPCTWYAMGSTTPIGYSGGIKVHPAVTTSYVVEMDLCGHVTYDTVTVFVKNVGISTTEIAAAKVSIYPNPANDEVTIEYFFENVEKATVQLFDLTGRMVTSKKLSDKNTKEIIDIKSLPQGVYVYKVLQNNLVIFIGKIVKQ